MKPKVNIIYRPYRLPFTLYPTIFHSKSRCHISSQSADRHTQGMACCLDSQYILKSFTMVQSCRWLRSHFCTHCDIVDLHSFFSLFKECLDDGTLEQMAYAFSCIVFISVSDGWSGDVLVKCFNDVFLSVCAPNSIVCWELLEYY